MWKTLHSLIQLSKASDLFQQLVEKKRGQKKKTLGMIQSIQPVATSYVLNILAGVLLLCPIDLRKRVHIAGSGSISAPSPLIWLEGAAQVGAGWRWCLRAEADEKK